MRSRLLDELRSASGADWAAWRGARGWTFAGRAAERSRPGAWLRASAAVRSLSSAGGELSPDGCRRDPVLRAAGVRHVLVRSFDEERLVLAARTSAPRTDPSVVGVLVDALRDAERADERDWRHARDARLARLGLAAATAAHDVRNLMAIALLESTDLDELAPHELAERARGLGTTLEETRELAEGFLADDRPLLRKRLLLAPLLEREAALARSLVAGELDGRGVAEVRVRCPAELAVLATRPILSRVVVNLVSNAVRASSACGGLPVEVTARETDGSALLEVRDRGAGMSAEEVERLLEAGRSGAGGSGFGTASVLEALELLDGRLEVRAARGAGCTFRATLTLAPLAGRPTLVLLERDARVAQSWRSRLRAAGANVLLARDARAAEARLRESEVAALLCARGTPGGGLARLRRASARDGVRWIELGAAGELPLAPARGAVRALVGELRAAGAKGAPTRP